MSERSEDALIIDLSAGRSGSLSLLFPVVSEQSEDALIIDLSAGRSESLSPFFLITEHNILKHKTLINSI